ncbi:lysozyme [bacterium]|nr:lysozyme [bacterium]
MKNSIKNDYSQIFSNNSDINYKNIDNSFLDNLTQEKARSFIQKLEGYRESAYKDIAGVWTIGYGHTGNVKPGDKITKADAEKLFAKDFYKHTEPLKYVTIPLSNNEKIALTSFIYNMGPNAFKKSTLLKKLNEGNKKAAADEFDKWIYSKGEISNGLINRRRLEKELFLKEDD